MDTAKFNLLQDDSPSTLPPYCPQEQPADAVYPQEQSGVAIYSHAPSASMPQPPTMMVVAPLPPVGPKSARLKCPSCHADIKTRLKVKSGTKTHILALLLCSVGCWLCCCIPYCKDSCKNAEHYCPSCREYIGSYSN